VLNRVAAVAVLLAATLAAAQILFPPADAPAAELQSRGSSSVICQFMPDGWGGRMPVCRPTEPDTSGEPDSALPMNPQPAQPAGPQAVTEVPLGRSHGTFTLRATVNGMTTLPFTLDSGASAVVIPRSVAEELIQNGTLTDDDYVGPTVSSLADGSLHRNDVITLHSITVGGQTVNNVKCVVGDEGSSLLLGETFLHKFKSWKIDNSRGVLTLQS
jgi:clan AA aspartic protease (TIGR02281 family)